MNENMKALFIIVSAGFAEEVIEIARGFGLRGATILNARGAGAPKSFMGITIDSEKEIIMSVVYESVAEKVMEAIKEKSGIKTNSHSFCFTMPVNKIVGALMTENNDNK